MTRLRINAPVEQATPLLERYAAVSHQLALAEADRTEALATANAVVDRVVVPLLEERRVLLDQLEPWWQRMGATLLTGKRKSVELGGCLIGSKAGRAKLLFAGGDDKAALAALQAHRWAKPYVRVTYAVDKTATTKALEGKHAAQLTELGFSAPAGDEVFFVDPVVQDGVLAGVGK